MSAGTATCRERLAADRASVGFLPRVGPLVPRNGALVAEAYGAHLASVGLLPRVSPLVPRNVTLLAEAPRAHGASVGLLAGVGPLVRRNVALVGEAAWLCSNCCVAVNCALHMCLSSVRFPGPTPGSIVGRAETSASSSWFLSVPAARERPHI